MKPITIPAEVMARQVSDETVLLHLTSGNYYSLDPVGTRFWQLLTEGKTLPQSRELLLAEYEVAPEQLDADLERLVTELAASGLVHLG
jgi:hypothetical protein